MRTLGIALLLAWITVGGDLLMLPNRQLDMEVAVTGQMLEEMKNSPLLEIPEVEKQIDSSKRIVADPSARRIVLWVKWITLFLLVMLGLWTAYAVFRQDFAAVAFMLTGALLFLGRQALFHRTRYELLLNGTNPIPWYMDNGYYQFAFSVIWYDYVLPVFFLVVIVFSCIHFARKWSRDSQPI